MGLRVVITARNVEVRSRSHVRFAAATFRVSLTSVVAVRVLPNRLPGVSPATQRLKALVRLRGRQLHSGVWGVDIDNRNYWKVPNIKPGVNNSCDLGTTCNSLMTYSKQGLEPQSSAERLLRLSELLRLKANL